MADHIAEQVEAAAAAGPAAKKQKTKPKVQNVSDALVRLGVVMKKEEKFAKASTMFVQLIENNMSAENSSEFLAVIEGTMEKRTWIHAQDKRASYAKLVQAVLKQREVFSSEHQWKMELFEFDVIKHGTLFTDDSYGFPSAVNAVQYDIETQLEALSNAATTHSRPPMPGTPEAAKRKAWEVAIMAALSKAQATSACSFPPRPHCCCSALTEPMAARSLATAVQPQLRRGTSSRGRRYQWQRLSGECTRCGTCLPCRKTRRR